MKQDLIDTFLVKNANILKVEEKIELQKQLQTCDDKAFTVLMSHNKPTKESNFWRGLLWVISVSTGIASLILIIILIDNLRLYNISFWVYSETIPFFICIVTSIASFVPVIMWHKRAKRKRFYEDYLKIIQSYQEATQSIE